jgi:hypothetical protein
MNIEEFHDKHGIEAARKICEKLGVTEHYWKGLKHRAKVPGLRKGISTEQAMRLAIISEEVTGDPLTVIDLLGLRYMPERLVGKVRGDDK